MCGVADGIAQEHGPARGDDRGAVVERAQVQRAQVQYPPQRRISGEHHLKAAIQHKTLRRDVGADAAADGIGGFQDQYASAGLGQ